MSQPDPPAGQARQPARRRRHWPPRRSRRRPPGPVEHPRPGGRIAVLLVLAGILTPVTLSAYWARTQVVDEGTYLATVEPLATDPAIQSAIATRVSNSIVDAIDVEQVVANLLPDRAEALAGPITLQVDAFVRRVVLQAVQSEAVPGAVAADQQGGPPGRRQHHPRASAARRSSSTASWC